jgi:hypothetical protein
MEYSAEGPLLKPLLIIGDQSPLISTSKDLLPAAFSHALSTLHSALPSASTIYISLSSETQLESIGPHLANFSSSNLPPLPSEAQSQSQDHDHEKSVSPELQLIISNTNSPNQSLSSALLAAHALHPNSKWLVLGCGYRNLPPTALQQLILEYEDPVTCFGDEKGGMEVIGIWSPEVLERMKEDGVVERGVDGVVKGRKGKLVRPLREEWIQRSEKMEEEGEWAVEG